MGEEHKHFSEDTKKPKPSVGEGNAAGPSPSPSSKVMFGDLINGICFTAFSLVYIYLWQVVTPLDERTGPRNTCVAFLLTTIFSWLSVWRGKPLWSAWAMAAMCVSIACMNIYKWPHPEVVVVPQYCWCLLIIAANQCLTIPYRVWLAVLAAVNALGVVLVLDTFNVIPLLLAASAIYACGLYYYRRQHQTGSTLISANAANLVLAGSFAYYASFEMMSMYTEANYATTGGYNILRIGFFAVAGLAASGSFKQEIEFKMALERKVAETTGEIRAQAEKLRKVERALQASETAIAITCSTQQRIEWSNAAFRRLAGVSFCENQTFWDMIHMRKSDRARLEEMFAEETKQQAIHEMKIGDRFCSIDLTSLEEEDKGLFMVVLKDVTERQARLEAEKAAEREALIAKASNESMQTLSHELRTPLQGIMGMTSLLLENQSLEAPTEVMECMSMVMTSSRLLLTLINNILDTRKCDAGRMDEFTLGPVPLGPSIQEAQAFCKPFATVSGVTLSMREIDEGLSVEANPLRLSQIMINLISNAIKYGPENSNICVSSRVIAKKQVDREISNAALAVGCKTTKSYDGDVVVISVCDEGKGIPMEHSARLFGRFAQFDADEPRKRVAGQPSGTGLGLSLCAEFTGRMGGQIWARNIPSGGCCFSFYLPRSQKPRPEHAVITPESNVSVSHSSNELKVPGSQRLPMRVLLVDDTQINLKVFGRMLEKLQIGTVKSANSGEKALELTRNQRFDLVITDLHMPGMQGTELSAAIHELTPGQIPIVVGLTADQSERVEAECREAGMLTVLHKPITQQALGEFFEQIADTLK